MKQKSMQEIIKFIYLLSQKLNKVLRQIAGMFMSSQLISYRFIFKNLIWIPISAKKQIFLSTYTSKYIYLADSIFFCWKIRLGIHSYLSSLISSTLFAYSSDFNVMLLRYVLKCFILFNVETLVPLVVSNRCSYTELRWEFLKANLHMYREF